MKVLGVALSEVGFEESCSFEGYDSVWGTSVHDGSVVDTHEVADRLR